MGQKAYHIKNINSPLDISMLKQGIYIVEINVQGVIKRSKLVKK